jgi:hypothetical protein
MKIIENAVKVALRSQVVYGFKETKFQSIYSYSEKYFEYFMYVILTKSDENGRKWREKNTLQLRAQIASNFTNRTVIE